MGSLARAILVKLSESGAISPPPWYPARSLSMATINLTSAEPIIVTWHK